MVAAHRYSWLEFSDIEFSINFKFGLECLQVGLKLKTGLKVDGRLLLLLLKRAIVEEP